VHLPSVQRREQFAVLFQLADATDADPVVTSTTVPGSDHLDLQAAPESLLDNGCTEAAFASGVESLVVDAATGRPTLTPVRQWRLSEDDV
jgi:hypothetical protein